MKSPDAILLSTSLRRIRPTEMIFIASRCRNSEINSSHSLDHVNIASSDVEVSRRRWRVRQLLEIPRCEAPSKSTKARIFELPQNTRMDLKSLLRSALDYSSR